MTTQLQSMASQLRCPVGEAGIFLGHNMNMRNLSVILNAIENLNISDDDHILEIGGGNGGLLGYILSLANNIHYTGLEISPTMNEQAIAFNQAYINMGLARYQLYDGTHIPFSSQMFNKIVTVNTLYFWSQPEFFMREICRVLKNGGYFCLTFCDKAFMQKLPFTQYGFKLYDLSDIIQLVKSLPLILVHQDIKQDLAINKAGTLSERKFMSLVFQKSAEDDR